MYQPKHRALEEMRQKLIELEKKKKKLKNTQSWEAQHPLSATDRTTRLKISRDIENPNNTINQ